MKSNVCKIENGSRDLEALFNESKKFALYNNLTEKSKAEITSSLINYNNSKLVLAYNLRLLTGFIIW